MAGKFNLAELIAEGKVSRLDTGDPGREQIEYIHIDRIGDDPNNFYEISGVEELAANIELLGLQQPLRVRTDPEDPEKVILVSGHRRRAAIRMLVDEGREELAEIPCIREKDAGSAALQELRLIYTNSDTRRMTPGDVSRQAERVEMLLYQLKEEGVEFPGRMRDHVAEACKISASKLARLKVIREGLAPGFTAAFERGALSEQAAYSLARLPRDFQQRLAHIVPASKYGSARFETARRLYEAGARWQPQFACPDGSACSHGDAALRHDLEGYDSCKGEQCCLTCDAATRDWYLCNRMCSKAQAQRTAKKQAEDEKAARATQKRISAEQRATQSNAQRLLKAIDAAGVPDETKVQWNWRGLTVGTIREYAAGKFDGGGRTVTDELLSPGACSNPADIARTLGCSTDFLLGLSEDPRPAQAAPAEGWVPLRFVSGKERPPRAGRYYCKFDCDGIFLYRLGWWDVYLLAWRFSEGGAEVHAPCAGWFPLPEDTDGEDMDEEDADEAPEAMEDGNDVP